MTERNLAVLESSGKSSQTLFEVEPPNLFRDPLIDSHDAGNLLQNLEIPLEVPEDIMDRMWMALDKAKSFSPIEAGYEARRLLLSRFAIIRRQGR